MFDQSTYEDHMHCKAFLHRRDLGAIQGFRLDCSCDIYLAARLAV
jgi:hypothetical protein